MAIISSRPPPRRIRAKRRQRNCEGRRKKYSFDLGLRDLETSLTKHRHEQPGETGRYLSSRHEFDVIYSSPSSIKPAIICPVLLCQRNVRWAGLR